MEQIIFSKTILTKRTYKCLLISTFEKNIFHRSVQSGTKYIPILSILCIIKQTE